MLNGKCVKRKGFVNRWRQGTVASFHRVGLFPSPGSILILLEPTEIERIDR